MDEGRFARQTCLKEVGEEGQERLTNSRVLVIGAGGTGSAVILYLAGAGLSALNICEPDVVEESNLHRQVLYTEGHTGQRKAAIASHRVDQSGCTTSTYSIHPFKRVRARSIYETGHMTHEQKYDVVLDCTDRWAAHDEILGHYRENSVPVVHGSIQGLIGRVMTFTRDTPCWRCLHPEKPTVTREGPRGTLGPVCGVVGSLMAMEALRILLGHGPGLAGEMLVYSAMKSQFETMTRSFDPACSCRRARGTAAASSGRPARGNPSGRKCKPRAAKLSDRAELLLGIVREGSDPTTGRIWIPRMSGVKRIYGEEQGSYGLTVSGPGDAHSLKALERRGLISPNGLADYAYIVTYAGIAEYEKIAARRAANRKAV